MSITAALTPEQWTAKRTRFEYWGDAQLHSTGEVTVRTVDPPAILRGPERHAVAALCLYEHPFGFTQADVETLTIAMSADEYRTGEESLRVRNELPRIRAKIAALLPPAP